MFLFCCTTSDAVSFQGRPSVQWCQLCYSFVFIFLCVSLMAISVQNLLSSRLLSKNLKIRIYKTIILLVVLYECETLSLTLGEEH
jgi:hypothetical protein